LDFIYAIAIIVAADMVSLYGYGDIGGILVVCGVIMMVFAVFALLGGVAAVTHKNWGLAVLGGIFAMLSVGPIFISSILGLIGLILVSVSRHEFDDYAPPTPIVMFQAPPEETRFCMGCGRKIQLHFNVCPFCGKPSGPAPPPGM
jgi:hypothetical protein